MEKSIRRILTTSICCMMVSSFLPYTAFAAGNIQARIESCTPFIINIVQNGNGYHARVAGENGEDYLAVSDDLFNWQIISQYEINPPQALKKPEKIRYPQISEIMKSKYPFFESFTSRRQSAVQTLSDNKQIYIDIISHIYQGKLMNDTLIFYSDNNGESWNWSFANITPGSGYAGDDFPITAFEDAADFGEYANGINYVVSNHFIECMSNRYNFSASISKGEFTALILRYFENGTITQTDGADGFADVIGHTLRREINAAKKLNFVAGDSKNNFGAGSEISRQDAFVILSAMLSSKGYFKTTEDLDTRRLSLKEDYSYIDKSNIQKIAPLVNAGIVKDLRPDYPLKRGEAAQLLLSASLYERGVLASSRPDYAQADMAGFGEFLKKYGDIGVYYENIESGLSYGYNENRAFFAASTMKAPYILYVYTLAEANGTDLEKEMHTYYSYEARPGSGILKTMPSGTVLNELELLHYTIRTSDNTGIRKMINKYGVPGYVDFVSDFGIDPVHVKTVVGADFTAREAGMYIKAIYNYLESGGRYSDGFKEDLMSTPDPLIISDYPVVRKYGWAQKSFHDMAVIYADSPYVLTILTDKEHPTARDRQMFTEISVYVQAFNDKWFGY